MKKKTGTEEPFNGKHVQIRELSALCGVPKRTVERVLDAYFRYLKECVNEQRVMHIPGLGAIKYKYQKKRITSQFTQVDYGITEIKKYPKFLFSKEFLRSYCKKYRIKVGD